MISACHGKRYHYQVFGTIGVSIKGNFIGQWLEIVVKELDPERLRGGNRLVVEGKLESGRSIDGCCAAESKKVDPLGNPIDDKVPARLNVLIDDRFTIRPQYFPSYSQPLATFIRMEVCAGFIRDDS